MSIRTRRNKEGKITGYQAIVERGESSTGKRLRDTKTFKTKKEAEAYINQTKSHILNGTYIEPNKMTVSQALDEWLETQVKPTLAPATVKSYQYNIKNHIRPALGNIQLQKLTAMQIQNFLNALDKEKNLSHRSMKYICDNLHSCLKYFTFKKMLSTNECDFVKVPKKKQKPISSFYSIDEIKTLMQAVQNDRLRPVVYLGLMSLRRSEMCALTWSDIDFQNNVISVNKNLVYINGEYIIGDCKTESSKRQIQVPPTIINLLGEYRRYQIKERMYCKEEYIDRDLIVCKYNGDYLNPATLSAKFSQLLKKHNLRHIRLHDLSHSYCSILLNDLNIPVTIVSKSAGHANTQVTLNTYSHVDSKMQKKSADALEENVFSDINKKLG